MRPFLRARAQSRGERAAVRPRDGSRRRPTATELERSPPGAPLVRRLRAKEARAPRGSVGGTPSNAARPPNRASSIQNSERVERSEFRTSSEPPSPQGRGFFTVFWPPPARSADLPAIRLRNPRGTHSRAAGAPRRVRTTAQPTTGPRRRPTPPKRRRSGPHALLPDSRGSMSLASTLTKVEVREG